jgi:peptide deformylase
VQIDLRLYPDEILSRKCEEVDPTASEVRELASEMMTKLEPWGAMGLAAPQVGYSWRLFVMRAENLLLACVNPRFDKNRAFLLNEEKELCLSIPGIHVPVARYHRIELEYQSLSGEKNYQVLSRWAARCAQHEIDHLDGITILDHLTGDRKKRALERYQKDGEIRAQQDSQQA